MKNFLFADQLTSMPIDHVILSKLDEQELNALQVYGMLQLTTLPQGKYSVKWINSLFVTCYARLYSN